MKSVSAQDVCDRQFRASHSKAPRGWGRWGFIFSAPNGPNSHGEEFWFCPIWSKFSDARRAAVRVAQERGNVECIEVAP